MIAIDKNPTVDNSKLKTGVEIVRISPRNQGVDIEFRCTLGYRLSSKLIISDLESGEDVAIGDILGSGKVFSVNKLLNDIDYTAEVVVYDCNGNELGKSPKRLFKTGYFPGKVINYIHPEDLTYCKSGRFLGSPYIIKLENGTYIASHDVFGGGYGALCMFFVSKDYGKTWNYLSSIERCCWGILFRKGDKIYIFGTTEDRPNADLVLYCSEDDGESWSGPLVLAKHTKDYSLRSVPTRYAEVNGRLWFFFGCKDCRDEAGFGAALASVDVNGDYMDIKNWAFTPFLRFDSNWEGVEKTWGPCMYEEGNVVVDRDGELTIMMRHNSHRYDIPESDPAKVKAIMLSADKDNPTAPLKFKKAIPFNGTLSKFYINYDKENDLYYAMLNRLTTNKIWQRNVLSLYSSYDLEKWSVERDMINLEDLEWHETNWDCGMQYPTWFIEDGDAVAVIRTALNSADNFHNSNAMTYHRFKGFREMYRF